MAFWELLNDETKREICNKLDPVVSISIETSPNSDTYAPVPHDYFVMTIRSGTTSTRIKSGPLMTSDIESLEQCLSGEEVRCEDIGGIYFNVTKDGIVKFVIDPPTYSDNPRPVVKVPLRCCRESFITLIEHLKKRREFPLPAYLEDEW